MVTESPVCGSSTPFSHTTPHLLQDALREAAQSPAAGLHFGSERISYSTIDVLSTRLAGRLNSRGVCPGDRVIVGLPNSTDFFVACFAIWKVRGIAVPLDTAIRANNLEHIISRTEPKALIGDRTFLDRVLELPAAAGSIRTLFLNDSNAPAASPSPIEPLPQIFAGSGEVKGLPVDGRPEDVATITFTSGSTGVPKGVMHTHASTLACAAFTRDFLGLSEQDLTAIPLPLHHVLAYRRVLTCILARCSAVIAPDIFGALKIIPTLRPTGLVLVPAACNIMIDNFASFLRGTDGIVKYIEIGSEPMSPARLNALQQMLPSAKIHLTYGLTEGRVGYLKPGPTGILNHLASSNHGLEIRVIDANGEPVPEGEAGEILLTGSGLMKGYWGDSGSAHQRVATFGFRTGDMGRADGNGNVELLGRMDDMLKVGGHKVNPKEIEGVLNQYPSVLESVVVGLPDPKGILEVQLHAFVVLRQNATCTAQELQTHCRNFLEPYKIPVSVHYRSSFPKTAVGKIQRHLVAESATKMLSP